jgi:hypothetical protein
MHVTIKYTLILLGLAVSDQVRSQRNAAILSIVSSSYDRNVSRPSHSPKRNLDTIFYRNGLAIEGVMDITQTEADGKMISQRVPAGYNLMDFRQKRYCFATSIVALKPNSKLAWHSLPSEQKLGVATDFQLYRNEPISEKDTVYDGKKTTVYHFTNYKGAYVTIVFDRTLEDQDMYCYDLERKFKKRIVLLKFQLGQMESTRETKETVFKGEHPAVTALKRFSAS